MEGSLLPYCLAVDLGTTYSAAAIYRNGQVELCTLGVSSPTLPSVVLLRADGAVLVGEAAERRGVAEPGRVAREFKRRLGDPAPLILGGTPYGADALTGHLLRAIVAIVAEREGEQPAKVVLTHPVNYGPYKLDMLREAARLAGITAAQLQLLPEPVAAAVSYASRQRVEIGSIFAVYDFGGGTFDAALLRRSDRGFEVIGQPEGMERFGGIDIDAAMLAFVDGRLDGAISALDETNLDIVKDISALREACRRAKETLSLDTDAEIRVQMPNLPRSVTISRADLEGMIRPRILETIESLRRTVASANIGFERVSTILLVGGSSRIPLVGQLVARTTGRPVSLDAHPKFAIVSGAAVIGGIGLPAAASTAGPSTIPLPTISVVPATPQPNPNLPPSPQSIPPPSIPAPSIPPPSSSPSIPPPSSSPPIPSSTPDRSPHRTRNMLAAIVAAVVVIAGIIVLATRDNGSNLAAITTEPSTTTTRANGRSTTLADGTAPTTAAAATTTAAATITIPVATTDPAPATVAATTAPAVDRIASDAAVSAALLNPAVIQAGPWQPSDVTFELSQDTCANRHFLTGLVVRKQQAFSSPAEGGQTEFLNQEIDVFATAAEAEAVVNAAIASTTNCTTTNSNDGQNLAITYATLPPQSGLTGCDQSFAFEEIESNATQTLNFDYVIVRCGNNLSWVRYSIGGASQQQARISLLAAILATSLPAIEAMPRN